jgi:hypothetical protein
MVCFIPADFMGPFVYYPVPRPGKRITVIACVAADGSFIGCCLDIAREAFDNELLMHGFIPAKAKSIHKQRRTSILTFLMIGSAAHFSLKFLRDGMDFHMRDRPFSSWTIVHVTTGRSLTTFALPIKLFLFGSPTFFQPAPDAGSLHLRSQSKTRRTGKQG